jgi:nucleoside 2-deoxyribosyltransferase
VAERKHALREAGFEGVDPLDTDLAFSEDQTKPEREHFIYQANRELMDSCDAIIPNLTPFRGVSADPGTVFEVGYMIGKGKPVFGFTLDSRHYGEQAGPSDRDEMGHVIEDFEMSENRFFSVELFNRCVRALANCKNHQHINLSLRTFNTCSIPTLMFFNQVSMNSDCTTKNRK